MSALKEVLASHLSGDVTDATSEIQKYSHDTSIFEMAPSLVVYPKDTKDVSTLVKEVRRAKESGEDVSVTARAGGTCMSGGPLTRSIVAVFTKYMNKVLEVRGDDLIVRVQPGVHRVALNEKLASSGLFFSVDPGAGATLGGMAATGAAGTTTVRYGSMRDNVLALTAVMADGTVIRTGRETRKLSAGYDLTRLLVGSEGTLAVITELTLRVFGIPEKMAAAIVRFDNLSDGVTAATAIVRSGISIARCEFLDAKCIKNVNAHDGLNLAEVPTLFFEFHGSPQGVAEDAASVKDVLVQQVLPGTDWNLLTVACICLFIGAMGKSAQFPLHVCLPDSMEGPTPISALIHAATMVTAGIFMVSRMSPLFELTDTALSFVLIIGSITALFMGFLGIVQNDIKRVVAYSTLSQLGYMTVALGVSAYPIAVFHLMTHAFFKALLFLGAGSVIMGMHHDQDMRNMGGLWKYMPITWLTSLLGSLALIGTPFFSGFYSKDSIRSAKSAMSPARPRSRRPRSKSSTSRRKKTRTRLS